MLRLCESSENSSYITVADCSIGKKVLFLFLLILALPVYADSDGVA